MNKFMAPLRGDRVRHRPLPVKVPRDPSGGNGVFALPHEQRQRLNCDEISGEHNESREVQEPPKT
eukprot:3204581-Amphidinium_carterae.1